MASRSYLAPRLLPFLALFIALKSILAQGFPQGQDWDLELVRVAEFKSAIINGQFPPFWAENLYGGYGSPVFIFYAPLDAFLSSLSSILTGTITGGITSSLIIYSLFGAFWIKFLLQAALDNKTSENEAASRIAVYFYILNPYLICDMYIRNANAEYAALCASPLALYGLILIRGRPRIGGLSLAAGLALTITAHNLTALITFALIITAALVIYLPTKSVSLWSTIVVSLVLGLGLSAFFWVPSIYYKSLVHIEQITAGGFDFHTQFKPIASFFLYDDFFAVGLLTPLVLLVSIGVIWIAYRRKEFACLKLNIFALCASFIFIFLQTRASVHIWERIHYLPFFQFPWRMMGPLALVTSTLAGLSFAYICQGKSKKITFRLEITVLIFCILNVMPHLRAVIPTPNNVTRKLPCLLSGKTIRNKGFSATVLDEFLPRPAHPGIWQTKPADAELVTNITSGIDTKVLKNSGTYLSLETNNESPGKLQIARWFFPGWECTINGKPQIVEASNSGTIGISVPAGFNQITLQLKPPLLRRVCVWISLACVSVWLIAFLLPSIKHLHRRPDCHLRSSI